MSNARILANTINSNSEIVVPSGGVNFGTGTDGTGTVTGGVLDDYEEGTWTPVATVSGFTTSISSLSGVYTKVGRKVTVRMQVNLSSVGRPTTYSEFSGLPFSVVTSCVGSFTGSAYSDGLQSGGCLASGSSVYWDRTPGTANTSSWYATATYFV